MLKQSQIIPLILVFMLCFNLSYSQNKIYTREKVNDTIKKLPRFTAYKNSYFITGVPTNTGVSSATADIKYQISFKQLITRNTLPWDTHLFFTYSQKAFWNVYKESSPFTEINFNPSIGVGKFIYNKNDRLIGIGSIAFEHESNGRDSIFSRSWNNIHGSFTTKIAPETMLTVKAWIPFSYELDNPNLLDYIGLGEATLTHKFLKGKLELEMMFRKGLKWDLKGAMRSRIYYSASKNSNQYFMFEWFNGYAESLIDYRKYTSMIRIGYVIRPGSFKLLNW